jgi:hypothetical protein
MKNRRLIQHLRHELNLPENEISDEDLLHKTKNSLLVANLNLKFAGEDLTYTAKRTIKQLDMKNKMKKLTSKLSKNTIRALQMPKWIAAEELRIQEEKSKDETNSIEVAIVGRCPSIDSDQLKHIIDIVESSNGIIVIDDILPRPLEPYKMPFIEKQKKNFDAHWKKKRNRKKKH